MKPMLTLATAAGITLTIAMGAAQAVPATPQSPLPSVAAEQNLLQPVHYPNWRCRAWRRECAVRWGWGTWRFNRCMRRHAC
jgi:hypothetical protein